MFKRTMNKDNEILFWKRKYEHLLAEYKQISNLLMKYKNETKKLNKAIGNIREEKTKAFWQGRNYDKK